VAAQSPDDEPPAEQPAAAGAAAAELRAAERGAADRLLFFSDAVVAIAITLLALDLPVPTGSDLPSFARSLGEGRIAYVAFLISFAVIAWHWSAHHRVLRYLRTADRRIVFYDLGWLLFIVLTPFLTSAIQHGSGIGPFSLYATAQAVQLILFGLIVHRAAATGQFIPGAPPLAPARKWAGAPASAAGFLVSIPVYLAVGSWAIAIWVLFPLLAGRLARSVG
jgi:uncharacterized membrane protein